MIAFKIVDSSDNEFEVIETFAGEDTHLTFTDSFRAALMFIALRRQAAIPRSMGFTIEFIPNPIRSSLND